MAEVTVTVNGHGFAIACEDGQEARIRRLAHYLDGRVGEFVKRIGQAGEARLLLLAALTIADELVEADEALEHERRRTGVDAETAADSIDGLAERIEAIAARLETS